MHRQLHGILVLEMVRHRHHASSPDHSPQHRTVSIRAASINRFSFIETTTHVHRIHDIIIFAFKQTAIILTIKFRMDLYIFYGSQSSIIGCMSYRQIALLLFLEKENNRNHNNKNNTTSIIITYLKLLKFRETKTPYFLLLKVFPRIVHLDKIHFLRRK